ncbi:MAG TPA: DegT/DnrJ/EryC1/StrS family aminotransferase [Candidatus Dormibacteraeota bacterium]|nr:DegT/DnrJ/EryC1/StrS family aminotransferase [Candidatus Dormibacteraeota bacterium]
MAPTLAAMLTLQSRHRLDIRTRDFAYALLACLWARDAERLSTRLAATWSPSGQGLACRSVRSGFHLLLDALDLPAGGEVLVSAVTHPDMVRILEAHGLVAVPVDLDIATLAPRLDLAERLVTPRTQAVLIAHLFGGRVEMGTWAAFARQHRLMLWEDCAQAFVGPGDTGAPTAGISMYSFGALKTCTALGGALLKVKDPALRVRMRTIHQGWPLQPRRAYVAGVFKFFAFSLVTKPVAYGLFAWLCRVLGRDFDRLVNTSVRAFRPGGLLPQLEVRPSAPLLATLAYRLRTFDDVRLRWRTASGDWLSANLPDRVQVPGGQMQNRTHWLFPVITSQADELISQCRRAGFDAARGASSVIAVAAPARRPEPLNARRMMACLVFIPAYPELPKGSLARLVAATRATPVIGHPQAASRLPSRPRASAGPTSPRGGEARPT